MAAQRVLWHALRQTRQSRSASPFCNGGRRRGLPFGDYAVHSPISSLAQLQHRTSIKENLLTVEETRRLLRVLSLEHLKKLIQENRKDCVSYKELLEICKRSSFSTSDEEATRIARELEETGTVLNFRGRIYLQPDQVARAIGNVMPLALPSENDPSRLELLQMTRQKAIIDQKAQKQDILGALMGCNGANRVPCGLLLYDLWLRFFSAYIQRSHLRRLVPDTLQIQAKATHAEE